MQPAAVPMSTGELIVTCVFWALIGLFALIVVGRAAGWRGDRFFSFLAFLLLAGMGYAALLLVWPRGAGAVSLVFPLMVLAAAVAWAFLDRAGLFRTVCTLAVIALTVALVVKLLGAARKEQWRIAWPGRGVVEAREGPPPTEVTEVITRATHLEVVRKATEEGYEAGWRERGGETDPVTVTPDGAGGATVMFRAPDAPAIIRTGIILQRHESVYIRAPFLIPGLRVGREDMEGSLSWSDAPPREFLSDPPLNYLLVSLPQAELVFSTATVPPGKYVIYLKKAPYLLRPGEYAPGQSVSRFY